MSLPLYDAHNHLQDERLAPHLPQIVDELARVGVCGAVVNGSSEEDWPAVAALARQHAWVRPSFGLHPWYVRQRSPQWQRALTAQLDAAGARAAIGEVGLDKWIPDHDLDDQREVFIWQLRLAAERNLPVSIHCLQAWGVLAEVLRRESIPPCGFLLHAYGGPAEMVGPLAKLGAYFSFSGHFLHDRKAARREVFRSIPLERVLIETDAPDMAPPPNAITHPLPNDADGKPVNHPANLGATFRALAALRGLAEDVLAAQLEENFRRLFGER